MNTERLLRLADLLEADAANPQGVTFDLGTWAADTVTWRDNRESGYDETTEIIPVSCGTTACAMGLAAISGVFKDDGLGWKIEDEFLIPTFEEVEGFDAATHFFDIAPSTAFKLFDPAHGDYYQTKGAEAELEVAKRIRLIVQNYLG